MGLIDSILGLFFVVGAGWFTIYYLVPKIESGEIDLGLSKKEKDEEEEEEPSAPSAEQPLDPAKALEDVLAETEKAASGSGSGSGKESDETPIPEGTELVPRTEKKKRSRESIEGGGGAGREEKKKKKEYRIIQWYLEPRGY